MKSLKFKIWTFPFLTLNLSFLTPLFADPLAESQARVGVSSGTVQILSQGAKEWVDVHEGLPIEPGDRIHADEDSTTELVMSDNVFWLLTPGSDVVFEHTDVNSGRLDVVQGVMLGDVDSAHASSGQHWEINTPGAACIVRGAEFVVDVSSDQGSRVGVYQGEVEIQAAETAEGESLPIRLGAPEEAMVRRGKALQLFKTRTPRLKRYNLWSRSLPVALARLRQTWTPYTTAYREEFRKKFIAPPPPPAHHHSKEDSSAAS